MVYCIHRDICGEAEREKWLSILSWKNGHDVRARKNGQWDPLQWHLSARHVFMQALSLMPVSWSVCLVSGSLFVCQFICMYVFGFAAAG